MNILDSLDINLSVRMACYLGSKLERKLKIPIETDSLAEKKQFNSADWEIRCNIADDKNSFDCNIFKYEGKLKVRVENGRSENTSFGIALDYNKWDINNYVLMPGAVYNGNRFESRKIPYSPKLMDTADIGVNKPVIITDIPRLNIGEGKSIIQQLAGDLSLPATGIYIPSKKYVIWLLTKQKTVLGNSGITISESEDRKNASITIMSPGVREETRYKMCDNSVPSEDRGADLKQGDEAQLEFGLYIMKAEKLQDLFDLYTKIMFDTTGKPEVENYIPFSKAFEIIKDKYNRQNWVEELGYYSVGLREMFLQDWQIGWTGGMIATYPLISEGDELTRNRALRNFDFVFPEGISSSGFFYDCGENGKWYGGDIRKPHTKNWHLIRKSGDGLYYVIKQLELINRINENCVNYEWKKGAKTVADSFVRLWKKYGQLGQFIDSQTGEIIVGGSTSGGVVPGALILAGKYYNEISYIEAAKEMANYLYEKYVSKGITNGGPGDALQNPDSESCYGLLASFVEIYEYTREPEWLKRAEETAAQYATWVVPYDFEFPEDSLFGRLGIKTSGSVYANTQNKHSAPAICTHSGEALFKLYRSTGNEFYLELLRLTAHNLVQYLSREDRPIGGLQPGWINERVNMSDWLEPVGEIFNGSTWAEVSAMLTYIEIPGLYVQPDTGFISMIDNFKVVSNEKTADGVILEIQNPTEFNACLKIFSETYDCMKKPLGNIGLYGCSNINIEPHEIKRLIIERTGRIINNE